ncbi:hypothetical protein F5883DRAFT_438489, partial [Diaporthe sp. PMI_573]
ALFTIRELYITKSISINRFPDITYFAQATKALAYLNKHLKVKYIKLYLLLSFYSMTLNQQYSTYLFTGIAMHTAIVISLYLNILES